jgi:hypothetical protein
LSAIWHVLVGDEESDGASEGKPDVPPVGSEVDVGPREGDVDDVGLEEDVGIADIVGDAVGESSQTGTSQ